MSSETQPPAPQAPASQAQDGAEAPLARVLIVDDEPDNIEVLARRLRTRRFQVFEARNGRDAGRIVMTEPLDLVLLDVMMPGVSGLETLKEIRKIRSSADLPVIMLTARDDKETLVAAMAGGANDYVVKPFDFEVTLARIIAQLKVRAAYQAVAHDRNRLKRRLDVRDKLAGAAPSAE